MAFSASVICWTGLQNSGKHSVHCYQFIIKAIAQQQPNRRYAQGRGRDLWWGEECTKSSCPLCLIDLFFFPVYRIHLDIYIGYLLQDYVNSMKLHFAFLNPFENLLILVRIFISILFSLCIYMTRFVFTCLLFVKSIFYLIFIVLFWVI